MESLVSVYYFTMASESQCLFPYDIKEMIGDFPARDYRLTEAGKRAMKSSAPQGSKVKLGKRGRGPESCGIFYRYCCGSNPYQGEIHSRVAVVDGEIKRWISIGDKGTAGRVGGAVMR